MTDKQEKDVIPPEIRKAFGKYLKAVPAAHDKQTKSNLFSFNRKQIRVVLIGIVLIFLLGLCPPWVKTYKAESKYSQKPIGHFLLIDPPQLVDPPLSELKAMRLGYGVHIDFSMLFFEWLIIVIAVCAIIGFMKYKAENKD